MIRKHKFTKIHEQSFFRNSTRHHSFKKNFETIRAIKKFVKHHNATYFNRYDNRKQKEKRNHQRKNYLKTDQNQIETRRK